LNTFFIAFFPSCLGTFLPLCTTTSLWHIFRVIKIPAVPTTNQPLHTLMKTTVVYSETSVRSFQFARCYNPQWTNFRTPQFEHRINTCLTPSQFCYFFTILFRLNTINLLQLTLALLAWRIW
jgi:hypothetical protein